MMSLRMTVQSALLSATVACVAARAAGGFAPQGGEYPIAGVVVGDQVLPSVALGASGGYVVWQDNATDGDGFGISARRIESNLLGSLGSFRVNQNAVGDQQNARVQMTSNGGAVFVWQGGTLNDQDVFMRSLSPVGTFTAGEIRLNTHSQGMQVNPAVAVLGGGNLSAVWSSADQDGSMQGIFGQMISPAGEKVGGELQINQFTAYNQRTPAIASLTSGGFVVAWVSEQQRYQDSVDIYGRIYRADGSPIGAEFLVNTQTNISANPIIAAAADGGFVVAWSHRDIGQPTHGWDVFARSFDSSGVGKTGAIRVNADPVGNDFGPQIASIGSEHMVVWTGMGKDGDNEGVFGRMTDAGLAPSGPEFQVNGFGRSKQMHPALVSDGTGQFLAVWTSFIGGVTSFDLFAQRYAPSAITPAAPFVSALSSTRLSVTWAAAGENTVSSYELYVDGASVPVTASSNVVTVNSLAPGTSHSFRLAYVFVGGDRSALSGTATGTTWGSDENLDGLPDDWQAQYWGASASAWPDPRGDGDGDGASILQEFLAGTNPTDGLSVLRIQINNSAQGNFLSWNTQVGMLYQVQSSTSLSVDWENFLEPRLAAGLTDSVLLGGGTGAVYYRVKRLR